MTGRLHGVGVEQHAGLAADCANLADRQDGADLVVGVHDGN